MMIAIAETLKQHYNAFVDQPRLLAFFSGLADYVSFILETPVLKRITDKVMEKKWNQYTELDRLENERLKELGAAKRKLLKIIKDNNIDPNSLSSHFSTFPDDRENLLKRLDDFEQGRFSISGFKSDNIERYLFDMAANIANLGHKELLKKFIVPGEEYGRYNKDSDSGVEITGNVHGNFVFSRTLPMRRRQESLLKKAGAFDLWGALDPLLKLQWVYSKKTAGAGNQEILNEFIQENARWERGRGSMDVHQMASDLEAIAATPEAQRALLDRDTQCLKIESFRGFVGRIHAHLLKELGNETSNTSFSDDGVLQFQGKNILISRTRNSDSYYLLKTVFKDKRRIWNNDEILTDWSGFGVDIDDNPKNKVYQAGRAVNKKVAEETTIKNFLEVTTKFVKVNEKYIE